LQLTKTKKCWLLGLLGVMALLAVAGCGTARKTTVANHIRYALAAEPESIDPRMSTSLSASTVEAQLFEGLTTLDEKNRPVAAAAENGRFRRTAVNMCLRCARGSNGPMASR
jgi:oligopeptide transport system substrate-binding protein